MRQEVQVYVTIKLQGLDQIFEENDEGDRQMGFGVVHCCYYVCKHMRQEVQVYVTIKLKGLDQRFEENDEGDRQMGFGIVHCCYYDKISITNS